ncbi:MAG TPA: lytic transglycosylase domain-containing protein [Candidatus Saccharimonadales bacterium]|nr:lytic transglycosylase domain-containing protein [Candidatus Saccharimonadales bacterium]
MLTYRKISSRDCLLLAIGAVVILAGVLVNIYIKNMRVPLGVESPRVAARWIPPTVRKWDSYIVEMAKKYDIDPNLIAIIITLESGGNPKAESPVGAKGLMQVTAPTAQDIATKFLKEPRKQYNLEDPRTNIEFGTAYLAYLRDEFGTPAQGPEWISTVELVAAGYNGGPGAANSLEQGKGLRSTETVVYSRDAFNMWRERRAASSPTFDRWKERGGSILIDSVKLQQKD